MSMAIVMTGLDGAILVADGRIKRPLGDRNFVQDDVDKIESLTDSIFAVRFGIEPIAASTIKALRARLATDKNCRPRALFASLESHLGNGWQSFLSHLPASVDPHHDALGVGVLCGGLAGGVPFLAGVVHHVIDPNPLLIFGEGPGRIYVIGFQDESEQELFYEDVERIYADIPWKLGEGPLNTCVGQLLATSGVAIRSVESQTADTGGVIRYAVVRKEFPVEKAIWKGPKIGAIEILEDGPTDCPDLPAEIKQEIAQILSDAGLDMKWFREHVGCGCFKPTPNEEKAASKVMKCLDEHYRADGIRTGTLTGLTVRTGTSGARIEMGNATYPNEISGYNAGGGLSLLIGPQSVQTDYGYFDHIGHTAGVCQLIDGQVTGRFSYSGSQVYNANAPVAWTNLNLSSYVGARRALVLLMIENNGAVNTNYRFRMDGSSAQQNPTADTHPGVFSCRCGTTTEHNYIWCLTHTNGYVEWDADQASSTVVTLLAYIN